MPTLSATRQAYLDAEVYTDAYCVRIVKADGSELYFTSYHADLTMTQKWTASGSPQTSGLSPSHVYIANTGYDMTAMQSTATLSIDNVDIMGIYASTGMTKDDLLGGIYDGAEVYIFLTDYTNPIEDEHPLKKALYGNVAINDNSFVIEFRGLTQYLTQEVGRNISILSTRTLAEENAPLTASDWAATTAYTATRAASDWKGAQVVKPTTANGFWYYLSTAGTSAGSEPTWPLVVDTTVTDGTCVWTCFQAYSFDSSVTDVTDTKTFTASGLASFPDGWFTYGVVTWLTGSNAAKEMECIRFDNFSSPAEYIINLFLSMSKTIVAGDTFTITVGYDRTLTQCKDKFDNVVNFGGFPHLPGPRTATRFGGQ